MNVRAIVAAAISAFACMLLTGCGGSVAGTYELDKAQVKAAAEAEMKSKQESDPNAAMGAGMMLAMIDAMSFTLTLNADGTANMLTNAMGQSETQTGTYTVSGSQITLTMSQQGEKGESITGTVKGDVITFKPPKDEAPFDMIFKKKAA